MEPKRLTDNITEISANIRSYVRLRTDLLKLNLTEQFSMLIADLMVTVILSVIFLFISLFISIAFIFWYRDHVGPAYAASLIVAAFYLVVGIIIYFRRRNLFVNMLVRQISQALLEDEDEEK